MVDKDKELLIGMLVASCDESGKLADASCVTFAGWLADAAHLNAMSQDWDTLLASHGISYIKMSEVLGFRGEFAGWKDRQEERDRLLLDLAHITQSNAICFVAVPISCEGFKDLPDVRKKQLLNPQYCGFETFVNIMSANASKLDQQLQIWCDSTEEFAETCIGLYHKIRSRNQTVRDTCISITFGEDQYFPPIQVADIYAACARQDSMRAVTKPNPLVPKLLEVFGQNGSFGGLMSYTTSSGLGSGIVTVS
jgi:hypothetical protein